MPFNYGLDIKSLNNPMGFVYGKGIFGPEPEIRRLSDIHRSLSDPDCEGPEELYAIVMDVGKKKDRRDLIERNLLFGVVTYSAGRLGDEPVRSQGHIHAVSPSGGLSTPEVYEIWEGEAVIYMQESGEDDPGRCYAVHASVGDVVIVPPGWVHATVNADPLNPMTFGAWCVRDYGFDYRDVRRHGGIAFFPKIGGEGLTWEKNPEYSGGCLFEKHARTYGDFGLTPGIGIYPQYEADHSLFDFVKDPAPYAALWEKYIP